MSKSKIDYVLDLGGSIVNPGTLDAPFLKEFYKFIDECVKRGKIFGIVVGGGFLTRIYQDFVRTHFEVNNEDLDIIGIRPTKLNAELIRIILKPHAYLKVLESPREIIKNSRTSSVFIFSGWKPGWSTDYISVLVAKRFGVREILSLTNIEGVYEVKNGTLLRDKIIPHLSWDVYEKIVGNKWTPGMRVPFDPVATKEAKKSKLKAVILRGENLENVRNYMEGREFVGTIIS